MSSSGLEVQAERLQAAREVLRRAAGGGQDRLELDGLERQPQRRRGGAGARALEADLPQVQLVGSEVRVRRVVRVEAPDPGVVEQHRAAAVGLEAVLVRVDHHRVGGADRSQRGGRVVEQHEEPAVRCIDVDAHAVPLAQLEGLVDPVDRAEPGGAGGEHDGADVAARTRGLEGVEVDPALRPRRAPRSPAGGGPGTCARACSGHWRRTRRPCPDAAHAPPTTPRGSRSCRSRSGARGTARRSRAAPPDRRPPPSPSRWSPARRRARDCWGSRASPRRSRRPPPGAAA